MPYYDFQITALSVPIIAGACTVTHRQGGHNISSVANPASLRLSNQTSLQPGINMTLAIQMPAPSAGELKAARTKAGLSQVEAATLMGYPVQPGSRGGLQSRTWQALESASDPRNMAGPIFAMFQLLTGSHPEFSLIKREALIGLDADLAQIEADTKGSDLIA